MRIQHNISALNTHRNLNFNNTKASKALEKLSSGYKINRAGDDAAGLAISEKMRSQIRGLDMATKNAQDSISLIQTAEGALNEVHSLLQRGRELAVQAANDTNVNDDREALQKEIVQINEEIDRIGSNTEFNTQRILQGSLAVGNDDPAVQKFLEDLTNYMLETSEDMVQTAFGISAPANTEITIKFEEGTATYNAYVNPNTPYEMVFNITNMIKNSSSSFEPDTTVAHEMTHAVMVASGISFNRTNSPDWFLEGSAEYLSGGNDRVRNALGSTPTDTALTSYVSTEVAKWKTGDSNNLSYGASYLAVRYLEDYLGTHGNGGGKNLGDLMQTMAGPTYRSLDSALQHLTTGGTGGTKSLSDFYNDLTDVAKGGAFLDGINLTTVGAILSPTETDNTKTVEDAANSVDHSDQFTYIWDTSTGHEGAQGSSTSELYFQIGANSNQFIKVNLPGISTAKLGTTGANLTTQSDAGNAIETFDKAIEQVSNERSYLGAIQNRLEHTIHNLGAASENLTSAESRIRDTDMAKEMMNFTKQNILMQAAQSMLSQANQQPQGVLQLLG